MPLTSANFNLQGATADDIAKFNLALNYLSQSPEALSALNASVGLTINIVHNGNDSYGMPGVSWDPNSGLAVSNNGVVGVQSAALGLAHEIAHSMDPSLTATSAESEAFATQKETVIANQLGEPTRDAYTSESGTVTLTNSTEHTVGGQWQQMNSDGQTVSGGSYGPVINPGQAPDISGGTPVDTGGDSGGDAGGGDDGGGDGGGCVSIDSLLPDGARAGDIRVGAVMVLADERTLEPGSGVVSYSQLKNAAGYRIVTESGASLKCSDSAPIPTPDGLVLAPALLGKEVAVRSDVDGSTTLRWEKVTEVLAIGQIQVQHITVGDKCFWAGEKPGAYILHHNLKDAGGDDPENPDEPESVPMTKAAAVHHSPSVDHHVQAPMHQDAHVELIAVPAHHLPMF